MLERAKQHVMNINLLSNVSWMLGEFNASQIPSSSSEGEGTAATSLAAPASSKDMTESACRLCPKPSKGNV